MIRITGDDTPIEAAMKIIEGTSTYEYEATAFSKTMTKMLTGKEFRDKRVEKIFDLEELKEIADYLTVYYNAHKE